MRSEIEFRDAKIAAQEKELESLRHPDLRSQSGPRDGSHRQLNSHLREPRDAAASALTDARRRQQVLEQEAEVNDGASLCGACWRSALHAACCIPHFARCKVYGAFGTMRRVRHSAYCEWPKPFSWHVSCAHHTLQAATVQSLVACRMMHGSAAAAVLFFACRRRLCRRSGKAHTRSWRRGWRTSTLLSRTRRRCWSLRSAAVPSGRPCACGEYCEYAVFSSHSAAALARSARGA